MTWCCRYPTVIKSSGSEQNWKNALAVNSTRLILKDHIEPFVVWVKGKNYEIGHQKKLINYAQKLSFYTHFFDYDSFLKIRDKLQQDAYYKAIRGLCNYFEEHNLDNEEILHEITKIRRIAKKP